MTAADVVDSLLTEASRRVAGMQASIDAGVTENARLEAENSHLASVNAHQQSQITFLQDRVRQLELGGPPWSFPVGVSLAGKGDRGGVTGWPAYRLYIGPAHPFPTDVTAIADVRKVREDGAKYICLSWKHKPTQGQLETFLASFAKMPEMTVDCCYFHEPEDNFPSTADQAAFRAEFTRQRKIVQGHGLWFGPILMEWTMNPKSGRDWRNWWDPESDFFGVEGYNPGRKKVPPVFDPPEEFLAPAFAAMKEAGKPTITGEFGMPIHPTDPAVRPAYIKSIVRYYQLHCPVPVRSMMYWDNVITNDNRLDRAAAEALKSMNG